MYKSLVPFDLILMNSMMLKFYKNYNFHIEVFMCKTFEWKTKASSWFSTRNVTWILKLLLQSHVFVIMRFSIWEGIMIRTLEEDWKYFTRFQNYIETFEQLELRYCKHKIGKYKDVLGIVKEDTLYNLDIVHFWMCVDYKFCRYHFSLIILFSSCC